MRLMTVLLIAFSAYAPQALGANQDWPTVGGDAGCSRYSPLTQINRRNVTRLQVTWTYHCGDQGQAGTIECTPIVIGGVMYLTTGASKVIALDAATGIERWRYDPFKPEGDDSARTAARMGKQGLAGARPSDKTQAKELAASPGRLQPMASGGVNRGVAYWSDGKQVRIFLGVADGRLISIDAATGKPDSAFGKGGIVDLRAGIETDLDGVSYGPTSAPAVWQDIVVLGFSCPEGSRPAPGDPRAFDARTGKELWRFHTIPRPGELGHETWEGDSWKHCGAANNWGGSSIDQKRGLIFMGTGSASPDFWGGGRKGDNLFANCTLCLDARTGRRLWHFQTLRHDLWDHDLPVYPNLVTVKHNGRKREAVAQVTKTGFVFLFDRLTGKPLFPVEDRPVPASDLPGEQASPTQPFPVKPAPFSRQQVTEADLTSISPEAHDEVLRRFRTYRTGSACMPPSTNGSITVPGFHGGATWSGASFDPVTGILYVNSNEQPNVTTMTATKDSAAEPFKATGYVRFVDKDGYPAVKPPWGLLNAIDLNKGEILWQVPLGEFSELTARGIPQTGTENFGGTIVTKGGLVFVGGSKDEMFHAFDSSTGKLLWQSKLDAGGYATPCTYMMSGRQYIVIAAGGGGKLRTKSGDAFVAFALPR